MASAAEWAKRVKAWRASGATAAEFAVGKGRVEGSNRGGLGRRRGQRGLRGARTQLGAVVGGRLATLVMVGDVSSLGGELRVEEVALWVVALGLRVGVAAQHGALPVGRAARG